MFRDNFGFRLKYKIKQLAGDWINRHGGFGIYEIRQKGNKSGKNALIIYTAEAVSAYLSGKLDQFTKLNSHSGFRESLLMLELLLENGYTVDFLHLYDTPEIHWNKYELVIDAGQSLQKAPPVSGQKKIFYATSCHWKTFRENQLIRCSSFQQRNGLVLQPDRDIPSGYSDEVADVITCFGGIYQKESFGHNALKVKELNISCTHVPQDFRKKINSGHKFMWYGGYGPFHKGLDLVVEAFRELPACELHIMGHLEADTRFYEWFKEQLSHHPHMHYHQWVTPESQAFYHLAAECDAVVFASSSEGGAGSVLQGMQFGLIPICNAATSLRTGFEQFPIQGKDPLAEISSIREQVKLFMDTPAGQKQLLAEQLLMECRTKYTLDSYKKSLSRILEDLCKTAFPAND